MNLLTELKYYSMVLFRALRSYWDGEPEIRWLPKLVNADRNSVDVGANSGSYTWWLAYCSKRCHAFEPNPRLARRLRSLGRKVKVHQAAVSDEIGQGELFVPFKEGGRGENSGLASLSAGQHSGLMKRIPINLMRLDDVDLGDVGFIKIDVEGFELSVLLGGEAFFEKNRPVCLIEAEDRHRFNAVGSVVSWFNDHDYAGFYLTGAGWKSIREFDVARDQSLSVLNGSRQRFGYHNNFLFVPVSDFPLIDLLCIDAE